MKAQSEPVKLVGASSRAYKEFTDDIGRTVPAGTAWTVEIKDDEGPSRRYKATAAAGEKAKSLPMGAPVVLVLDVRAATPAKVIGVEASR